MRCVRSEKFLYWEKSRQKNGEIHSSTSFSYLVFILLVLYVVGSKVAHTEKLDTFSFERPWLYILILITRNINLHVGLKLTDLLGKSL